MIEVEAKLRKWGNSLGVLIPRGSLEGTQLHEGSNVKVIIRPKKGVTMDKFFGTFKTKRSTEEMLREVDEDLSDE